MEEMIQMLAKAPEEERKALMTERLQMFASMPEEQRVESIAQLVQGLSTLKAKQREEFIKGRTMIIASLPEEARLAVMAGRMKAAMKVAPEVHESDMELTERAVPALPEALRDNFTQSMAQVKQSMGAEGAEGPSRVASRPGGAPTHHGQPMVLKGLLSKNYVCTVCGLKQPA